MYPSATHINTYEIHRPLNNSNIESKKNVVHKKERNIHIKNENSIKNIFKSTQGDSLTRDLGATFRPCQAGKSSFQMEHGTLI
jgi:hypothetical protein